MAQANALEVPPELVVDLDSPVPVYEQLRGQVTELVESGTLPRGYSLPPIRSLAATLGLAPGTVARAYRELEESGVVTCSRARGTRVARPPRLERAERRGRLDELAMRFTWSARRLRATDAEIRDAVARALRTQ